MINQVKLEIFKKYNKNWAYVNEYLAMNLLPVIKKERHEKIEYLFEGVYVAGRSALYKYTSLEKNNKYTKIFIVADSYESYLGKFQLFINQFDGKTVETEYYFKINNYMIIKKHYNSVSEFLSSFDLSICKIAFDYEGSFYYTPDFKYSLKTKTIGTNYNKRQNYYIDRIERYVKEFRFSLILYDCGFVNHFSNNKIPEKLINGKLLINEGNETTYLNLNDYCCVEVKYKKYEKSAIIEKIKKIKTHNNNFDKKIFDERVKYRRPPIYIYHFDLNKIHYLFWLLINGTKKLGIKLPKYLYKEIVINIFDKI